MELDKNFAQHFLNSLQCFIICIFNLIISQILELFYNGYSPIWGCNYFKKDLCKTKFFVLVPINCFMCNNCGQSYKYKHSLYNHQKYECGVPLKLIVIFVLDNFLTEELYRNI